MLGQGSGPLLLHKPQSSLSLLLENLPRQHHRQTRFRAWSPNNPAGASKGLAGGFDQMVARGVGVAVYYGYWKAGRRWSPREGRRRTSEPLRDITMPFHRDNSPHHAWQSLALPDWVLNVIAIVAVLSFVVWALAGPLLWFFRCDLVVLFLFLFVLLSGVIALGWGIFGVMRLIEGLIAGRPFRVCFRHLVIAAVIFLVAYCPYKLATWYPELSEWRLKGLTASEVIERVGPPRSDSREHPNAAPPGEVYLGYSRSFWWYSVRLKDDRVVGVVVSGNDK